MKKENIKVVLKKWGREEILVNNDLYCGKLLFVKKGGISSLHMHKIKQETFFCYEGTIALIIREKDYLLSRFTRPKTILPGEYHQFRGISDAMIIEISTPHDDKDVYRLTESKEKGGENGN